VTAITASKIAEILETLSDGEWHRIDEIGQKMKLNETQIEKITTFLQEYDFVVTDAENKKIRIKESARKFLMQTANK
jgi:DNA-binding IclR family transcriptional regulator